MTGVLLLDKQFKFPESFDIGLLETLPIYKHRYGMPMEANPTTLYWTEYQPTLPNTGTISFARKLYIQYPEVAMYISKYLESLFPRITFDYRRVNLLKTKGSIQPHVDESNRSSCINIGIKNSSISITRASSVKEKSLFLNNFEEVVCQDNHAYLLDTSSYHEVVSTDDTVERFLFTYGLGVSFETMVKEFNFKG